MDSNSLPTTSSLPVALLALVFIALSLTGGLLLLRRARQSHKEAELPLYNDKPTPERRNRQRLAIIAYPFSKRTKSLYVVQENQTLLASSSSPLPSPVPEIHITFPDQTDGSGKRQSGRVVIVRVGEHGIGLEPMDDSLPPYTQSNSNRFDSLDLERIGGLKEKEQTRA